MPFGEQQFENPPMPSAEKPEKIEEEPIAKEQKEPREEIKIPEKEEPTEVGDNLELEQIRGELKKLQEAEALEKTPEGISTKGERGKEEKAEEDPARFLGSEKLTQSNEEMKKIAESLRGKTEQQTLENVLSFLGENLKHVDLERKNPKEWKKLFNQREAQEIFESKTSYGCTDTASLFSALMREASIPTKFVEGKRIGKSGTHSWAETLIGGKWVDVDPTQGSKGLEFDPEKVKHGPYVKISESLGPSDSMITSYKDWKKIEKAWDYKKNAFKKER